MRIDVHHDIHVTICADQQVLDALNRIEGKVKEVMATQQELAAEVRVMKDQVVKIGTETQTLIGKVNDLIALVEAGGNVVPELRTAIDETKAQLQIVDDLVPDAEPPPPPVP